MDILEQIAQVANRNDLKDFVETKFKESIANLTKAGFKVDPKKGVSAKHTEIEKTTNSLQKAIDIDIAHEIHQFNAWHFLYWGMEDDNWDYAKYSLEDKEYLEKLKIEIDKK